MRHLLLGNHGPFAFGFALRAAVWTPAQLPQVQAWWDASDESTITLNANRVAAIADKSLNAYTLTQPTAADQPIYDTSGTVSSLPMLQQDSTDSLISTTTSLLRNTGDAYIFAVGYYPTTANSTANYMLVFVSSGTVGSSTRMGLTAYPTNNANALSVAGRRLDTDSYDVLPSSTTRASIENTLFLETGRRHYSQNKTYHWTNGNIDLNGVAFSTQTAGNTSDTDPLLVSLLAPNVTLSTQPNTRVGEVIICNQTLSEADRQRVEGYLAWKWGGDALWTPAQLPLDLWFDSSDEATITLNGSTVSQWSDKSGNARHISQANAAQQPTYITAGFNGKNIMRFDGSNDYLFNPTVGAGGKSFLTMISVFKMLSASAEDLPMGTGVTSNEIRSFYRRTAETTVGWASWGNDVNTSAYSYDVGGTYHIFESWQPQLATPDNVVIGRDGSFSAYSTKSNLTDMTDGFNVGSMQGGLVANYYTNMEVGEIVAIYDNISTDDRQRVEGYLAHKWGLTANLPATHPYKYQAPRL